MMFYQWYKGCKLCKEHICLFINHNRWKKTGCTIDYLKILWTLRKNWRKFSSKGGEEGSAV